MTSGCCSFSPRMIGTLQVNQSVRRNSMSQMTPVPGRDQNGAQDLGAVARELKRESDRLRLLADELKTCEATHAEMQANYPHFKQAVYASLREQFERELAPLADQDLETLATEEGA